VPLTGNSWAGTVEIEGQPPVTRPNDEIILPLRAVTPGYFQLLGLAISDGRDFRDSDSGKTLNVALVNQAFTARYFKDGNSVGKKIWLFSRQRPAATIIGVVSNARTGDLTQVAEPEIYLSLWQANAFSKHLVIRTSGDPRAVMGSVQRAIHSVNPTAAIENTKTLEQIRGDSLASRAFAMQLLVGFSLVGSALTLVGIYGVLSLSVASRRREIAIRTAVGAERRDIRKLIFAEGFRLVASGVLAGIIAALLLSRVVRSFLYGVEPTDPMTLTGVGVLFAIVAMLPCWAPTHPALKVDPMEALRYE